MALRFVAKKKQKKTEGSPTEEVVAVGAAVQVFVRYQCTQYIRAGALQFGCSCSCFGNPSTSAGSRSGATPDFALLQC